MAKLWLLAVVIVQLVNLSSTTNCDAEDALELYPCQELEGDVDISSWFNNQTQLKIRKNAVKLVSAKGKMTIRGINATRLDFPKLADVSHLEIIDNQQLTDIHVPNLKTIGKLTIIGNPRLIYEKLKAFENCTVTDLQNSTVECLTAEEDVFSSADDLKLCGIIKGPLIIKKADESLIERSPWELDDHYDWKLNIKEVHGCIHVEETGLTSLDFLKKTKITGCSDRHIITNNSNLCPPMFLEKNSATKVVISGSQKPYGCGKVCGNLAEGNCNVIRGFVEITSETTPEMVAELEVIENRVDISDTTLESFEFPKLVEISAFMGPVLMVNNNPNLKSLKMPKIKVMQFFAAIGGVARAEILNNPKLDEDCIKRIEAAAGCVKTEKKSCGIENPTRSSNDSLPIQWLIGGGAVALLISVIAIIIGGICCYKKKKQKKMKSVESSTKTTSKETATSE